MTSLCLCMIVRDEVENLGRCLDSCRGLIDYWVICDTGSTDGTQELIRRGLAGVPGELYERHWVDFGYNRSELMRLAHRKADYLLLLDADWTVEAVPGALANLSADSYMVKHSGEVEFHNKRLVSGRIPWRYVGATHEYITSDEERSSERLNGLVIHVHSVGGSRTGRWQRDLELLRADLERDPDDSRAAFYAAQTHRDIAGESGSRDDLLAARSAFQRRAQMAGWEEETYWSWYQVGVLSLELDEWPTAQDAFMRAWEVRPRRLEAVHDLASQLRVRGLHRSAHLYTSLAASMRPLPVPSDDLFVMPWVYRWGMLFEYSISCYWVGELDRAVLACDRLLRMRELPDEYREQTRRNRRFAIDSKARRLVRRVNTTAV
jgi:hypothetical protein